MSKKPLKHSELKKQSSAARMKGDWGKRRSAAPVMRMRPEKYLIVTEGVETEPNYFNEIKALINEKFYGRYITVAVEGKGMNTLSLFDRAKETAEDDPDGFTQVWVVYDKDDFPAGNFNDVVEKCKKVTSDETVYRAAWSNESFELWFVLHFEYSQSALNRKAYEKKTSRLLEKNGLGPYEKNRTDMFSILKPYVRDAIRNAKKLERVNEGKTPTESNPGTNVHKLVEKLLPYTEG